MKASGLFLAAAALAVTLSSCVSSKKYAQLETDYKALQGDYKTLQGDYQTTREGLIECNAETRNLQSQLDAARKANEGLKASDSSRRPGQEPGRS